MPKIILCPFCGANSPGTKEHVWAQWMHNTPGAQRLLRDYHGERIENVHETLVRNSDGRYEKLTVTAGKFAELLPHVIVYVCGACNSGWMSDLENAAQRLLSPFVFTYQGGLKLSLEDLQALSTWVTKTWMSYALTRSPYSNPFGMQEYRRMASDAKPLARSRIWMLHCHSPGAQVGIGIASSLMGMNWVVPALDQNPDNMCFAYMAVSSVVFYMVLAPAETTPDQMESLTPRSVSDRGVRPIWPARHPILFPVYPATHLTFASLYDAPREFHRKTSLPVEGKTHDEVIAAAEDFWGDIPGQ